MNNNLYEYGGSCDVIIRCASERTIGGKHYAANEPYTKLENVFVDLQYATINSEQRGKENVLAARSAFPHIINIRGLTLTNKINQLIATKIEPQTISRSCTVKVSDGVGYLPEKANPNNLFVYNGNERISNVTLSPDGDKITGELEEGSTFLVFYEVNASTPSFDLTAPHFGYFTIEVIGHGNVDKRSKEIYMKFPACSLMSNAVFNFINGNILNAPLQFECIYKNQQTPYFNIGN